MSAGYSAGYLGAASGWSPLVPWALTTLQGEKCPTTFLSVVHLWSPYCVQAAPGDPLSFPQARAVSGAHTLPSGEMLGSAA